MTLSVMKFSKHGNSFQKIGILQGLWLTCDCSTTIIINVYYLLFVSPHLFQLQASAIF